MAEGRYKHDKPYREVGWQSLADAIVEMAVTDYKNVLLARNLKTSQKAQVNRAELERFFKSQWFEMLSDYDGGAHMRGIQRRVSEIDNQKISWSDS